MPCNSVSWLRSIAAVGVVCVTGGCGEAAHLTVAEGMGPRPVLPPPDPSLIPVIDVAPAIGWSNGGGPVAADGLAGRIQDLDRR